LKSEESGDTNVSVPPSTQNPKNKAFKGKFDKFKTKLDAIKTFEVLKPEENVQES